MPITKTGKKEDGLLQYRVRINYIDSLGKARQVERTAYGLDEAKQLENLLLTEYKEKRTTSTQITIKQLFDEYETYHSHETRKTSHDTMVRNITLKVLPYMSDYKLSKLTQQALADWKNKLNSTNLSIVTKKNAYAAFNSMLNYAVKMNYLVKNPLSVLGNFKDTSIAQAPSEKIHYYTKDQFLSYIEEARNACNTVTNWGYYVFFNIAFFTGARKGEINALKWSDIEGNTMHIRRSIAQKLKGGDVETPPKNKSSYRDLQMPQPLIDILAQHKQRQMDASKSFTDDYRVCGGLLPLRDTSIDNKNRAFAEAAELPHIRIHDFRHTHASLLVNEGINIQEIARRLGHSDVQMTWNTYSHLYPREEERAVQILDAIQLK